MLTKWLVNKMSTEERILQEAREIFYHKGLAGARMQEIADNAEINKAMLHYYFKTKEQLFDRVFVETFKTFSGQIADVLNGDMPLEQKITHYVNTTIDTLQHNPGIPVFVLNELTFNPDRITDLFAGEGKIGFTKFKNQVKEQSQGKADAESLFIDMVALCVYPFVVAPIFKKMLQKTDQQYTALLQKRKKQIIKELLEKI